MDVHGLEHGVCLKFEVSSSFRVVEGLFDAQTALFALVVFKQGVRLLKSCVSVLLVFSQGC